MDFFSTSARKREQGIESNSQPDHGERSDYKRQNGGYREWKDNLELENPGILKANLLCSSAESSTVLFLDKSTKNGGREAIFPL